MDLEKKINMIGQILADIQLDVKFLRREQAQLRSFITNPDRVEAEKKYNEFIKKEKKRLS